MGMVSLVSMMSDGDEEVQNNNPRLWMDHIVEWLYFDELRV